MATVIPGYHPSLKALADKLCPGRNVAKITLEFPARGICTATVEVALEKDDIPLVEAAVDAVQPEVIVVSSDQTEAKWQP